MLLWEYVTFQNWGGGVQGGWEKLDVGFLVASALALALVLFFLTLGGMPPPQERKNKPNAKAKAEAKAKAKATKKPTSSFPQAPLCSGPPLGSGYILP